jgi:holo-[acyl-carrier protein] synthase
VTVVPTAAATLSRRRIVESLEAERLRPSASPRQAPSEPLRVGVDLVPVADVAASVDRLGRRYLYRLFTPHERACARVDALGGHHPSGYSVESLAARFAAKEAAVKVLRPVGPRPEWRSIEVRRTDGGWCELRLSGLAASLAAQAGITTLAVSVTHEPMMAAACVVGTADRRPAGTEQGRRTGMTPDAAPRMRGK